MKIKVIKRSGDKEDFCEDKIIKVVKAAGLDHPQAQTLSKNVCKWVAKNDNSEISSLKLRDKIIQELQKTDQVAADCYIWYQKLKDRDHNNS